MSLTQRLPFVPRALVALMSCVLVLLLGMTHAWAQSSEPVSTGTLESSVDPGGVVEPGDVVTMSGSGFAPGARIDIVLNSDPIHLATVEADATGFFEVTVPLPAGGLPAGRHTLTATGPDPSGGLRVLSVPVVVASDPAPDDPASDATAARVAGLPVTGSPVLPLAALGALAVAVGSALVVRQRRTS